MQGEGLAGRRSIYGLEISSHNMEDDSVLNVPATPARPHGDEHPVATPEAAPGPRPERSGPAIGDDTSGSNPTEVREDIPDHDGRRSRWARVRDRAARTVLVCGAVADIVAVIYLIATHAGG